MKFKLVDITQSKSFPDLRPLTPEEETAIIAQCKAEIDPVQMEAEFRALLEQHERGELVDADELLREMQTDTNEGKP